jgi:hypothetical protein
MGAQIETNEILKKVISLLNETVAIRENADGLSKAYADAANRLERQYSEIISEVKAFIKRIDGSNEKQIDASKKIIATNKQIATVLTNVEEMAKQIEKSVMLKKDDAEEVDTEDSKNTIAVELEALKNLQSELKSLIKDVKKAAVDLGKNLKAIDNIGSSISKNAEAITNLELLINSLEEAKQAQQISEQLSSIYNGLLDEIAATKESEKTLQDGISGIQRQVVDEVKAILSDHEKKMLSKIEDINSKIVVKTIESGS